MTRLAVVLGTPAAVPPPGVDTERFAAAARSDCYDVVADLDGVESGVADWPRDQRTDLWPHTHVFAESTPSALLDSLSRSERWEAVVLVPPDVPDLPGLLLAKAFQAIGRAAVAVAPALPGPGWVALGVRLPLPGWWPSNLTLTPDDDPTVELQQAAPRRNLVVHTPGWHRLDRPEAVHRLDPGLEGWDQTRDVLSAASGPRVRPGR